MKHIPSKTIRSDLDVLFSSLYSTILLMASIVQTVGIIRKLSHNIWNEVNGNLKNGFYGCHEFQFIQYSTLAQVFV